MAESYVVNAGNNITQATENGYFTEANRQALVSVAIISAFKGIGDLVGLLNFAASPIIGKLILPTSFTIAGTAASFLVNNMLYPTS